MTAGPIQLWALGVLSWGTPMLPSSCTTVWSQRLGAPCPLACSPFSCWTPQSLMPLCGLVSLAASPRMGRICAPRQGVKFWEKPHLPIPHCLYPLANPCLCSFPLQSLPVFFRGSQGSFLTPILFFPVPGLGPLPFHFAQPLLTTERLSGSGLHRPLNRTRSEPLPPSATASPLLGPLQPRQDRLKPHVQLIKVRGTG